MLTSSHLKETDSENTDYENTETKLFNRVNLFDHSISTELAASIKVFCSKCIAKIKDINYFIYFFPKLLAFFSVLLKKTKTNRNCIFI